MCRKAKCAYLRKNGYCLLHRAMCEIPHPDVICHDGAARAIPSRERHLWEIVEECDHRSARGRFAFSTRNVRGHIVYRTCSRKCRYPNPYAAHEKAVQLKQRRGVELSVYECPFCGGYHLTHRLHRNPFVGIGIGEGDFSAVSMKKTA